MNSRLKLSIFIGLCILGCALAASTSPKVAKRKLIQNRSIANKPPHYDTTKAIINTVQALARSHSTSEVLTLNLTNLLILVVLKAVIFGIGLFYFGGVSFGGKGGGGHGRSDSTSGRSLAGKSSSLMTQGEMLLMMTYILGATKDNYECMNRVACEDPSKAKDYLNASKMILKGAKFAKKYVSYNPKYEQVVFGLEEAVQHKASGGDCKAKYVCSDIPSLTLITSKSKSS